MNPQLEGGRAIRAVLELLKNAQFCEDARCVIADAAAIREQAPSPEEGQQRMQQLAQPFLARWGVLPPTTDELLDPDPRRRLVEAIAAGRWGIVPVFPLTTDQEIREGVKKIRKVIRKQHQDALITRGAQLVGWLEVCGYDRPAIARVVFGRRTGLRRPTRAEAIARTSEDLERQLYEEYRKLELTANEIEQRIYRRLRGSEARASAAVRMADRRYVKRIERLNEALATPIQSEPLSHALTLLFRALPDEHGAAVRRLAIATRAAFERASLTDAGSTSSPDATTRLRRREVLISGRWGLVPMFPWTTAPEIRTLVKAIRALIRTERQGCDGLTQASAAPNDASPSDALTLLIRALADDDDAAVRRLAVAARRSFLRASP